MQSIGKLRRKEKATSEDIPRLSAYSALLMSELQEGTPTRLSKIRPNGLTVDKPFRIAMMAPTQYLIAYVREIARQDIDKARSISELIEVPVVKQLQGESKYVVEKKHLSDVILEEASRIGEEAGKDLAKLLVRSKVTPKQPQTDFYSIASQSNSSETTTPAPR